MNSMIGLERGERPPQRSLLSPVAYVVGEPRLAQHRVDQASAQANLYVMSDIVKPSRRMIEQIPCLIEERGESARRQSERTRRQALTVGTNRAIMIDTCTVELERRLVFNFDRCDTYPTVKWAIMDEVEQMRHEPDPMEIYEMAYPADDEYG